MSTHSAFYASNACVIPVQWERYAVSPTFSVSITVKFPVTPVYLQKETSLFRNRFPYSESFVSGKVKCSETSVCRCGNQQWQLLAVVRFVVDEVALGLVVLRVHPFYPVSIIPPLLPPHSFIYHRRCIMFCSQYFSFPLSVSFHQCSILIHRSACCCYQKDQPYY
jgi:hypothetical protein